MKDYIKKILLILVLTLLFTSCGSDDNQETVKTEKKQKSGLRYFPGEDFSMRIPAAWNNITKNKDVLPTPNNGKIELAVTSSETKNGFANTLIILSQDLEKETSSKDYSITNNVGAENKYFNYFKKAGKEFSFDDGEKSMIYIFKAKYSEDTPLLNFLQTAYVCENNKAFFLTIALNIDIKETNKYEKMLKTFKCK